MSVGQHPGSAAGATRLSYTPHVLADTTKHETGECRPQRLPVRNENVGGLFPCQAKNQELRPLVLKQPDCRNAWQGKSLISLGSQCS